MGTIQGAGSQPEAEGPTPTSRGAVSLLPAEGPPTWGDPGEGGREGGGSSAGRFRLRCLVVRAPAVTPVWSPSASLSLAVASVRRGSGGGCNSALGCMVAATLLHSEAYLLEPCSDPESATGGRWVSQCFRIYIWEGRERAAEGVGSRMLKAKVSMFATMQLQANRDLREQLQHQRV